MTAILIKFLRPAAPYLAAAALLLTALLYVMTLRHDLQTATKQNAALLATNQANAAAITQYQAQAEKWSAALDALDAQSLATNTAAAGISAKITAAPAGDDAPVAPVLAQALDGLRALQGSAP